MSAAAAVGSLAAKAKTGEALKAGPGWFAVVLVLGIVCYFLFKSMSKHMRAVRENFPVSDVPRRPAVRPTPSEDGLSTRQADVSPPVPPAVLPPDLPPAPSTAVPPVES